jgi:Zn-dependent protease
LNGFDAGTKSDRPHRSDGWGEPEPHRPIGPEGTEPGGGRRRGPSAWRKAGGATGAALLFLLTKGKTALLFLLKFGKPLITMAVTIGAYAMIYPWTFAVGLVALIFAHEMGHVLAAKRKGIPVSAPLFIPFLGAFIAMKRHPKDAAAEAFVAIGGPLLGSAAALVCCGIGWGTGHPVWMVLAYVGFFLNLFNLLPIPPLDGGRIVGAVSRWLWAAGAVLGPLVVWTTQNLLVLLIWLWFLWEMYKRFFRRGRAEEGAEPYAVEGSYRVAVPETLPDWYWAGETHQRELPYTFYCRMDGTHVIECFWEALSFRGGLEAGTPCLIRKVYVRKLSGPDADGMMNVILRAEGVRYESGRYYAVGARTRLVYGLLYGGLLAGLLAMLWLIEASGLPRPLAVV